MVAIGVQEAKDIWGAVLQGVRFLRACVYGVRANEPCTLVKCVCQGAGR